MWKHADPLLDYIGKRMDIFEEQWMRVPGVWNSSISVRGRLGPEISATSRDVDVSQLSGLEIDPSFIPDDVDFAGFLLPPNAAESRAEAGRACGGEGGGDRTESKERDCAKEGQIPDTRPGVGQVGGPIRVRVRAREIEDFPDWGQPLPASDPDMFRRSRCSIC